MLRHIRTLFERTYSVETIEFNCDGSVLATSGGYRGGAIRVWDTENWSCQAVLKGHKGRISSLVFADDELLVSGGKDKSVRCWNWREGREVSLHTSHDKIVFDVAANYSDSFIASGGRDGRVFLWSMGKPPVEFAVLPGSINSLTFSPTHPVLVTGGGVERRTGIVHVWDVESHNLITALQTPHQDWVLWIGYSGDGSRVASGSYGEICLWDTSTWEPIQTLKRPTEARFSTIAFSFTEHQERFLSGAWSHEESREECRDDAGRLLGWNVRRKGLLQDWNLNTGSLDECQEVHPDALTCLSHCSATGSLATGGQEGAVKIWSLEHA